MSGTGKSDPHNLHLRWWLKLLAADRAMPDSYIRVMLVLSEWVNRKRGCAFKGNATYAREAATSPSKVERALRRARDLKYLETKPGHRGRASEHWPVLKGAGNPSDV